MDEQRLAYRAAGLRDANLFHLVRKENNAARNRAKSAGHRQHKLGANPFQLGGSFVFGPGNVDRFAHVSRTFGDNAPVESLLAALIEGNGRFSNRSIPSATVIPVLAYPDVNQAAAWLCDAFGFSVRLRIGDHRVQLNVGDGAVIVRELRRMRSMGRWVWDTR